MNWKRLVPLVVLAALIIPVSGESNSAIGTAGVLMDSGQTPIVLLCGQFWEGHASSPAGYTEILIKDGFIKAIGKDVGRPAGCKVVDLKNQTVTPGFIDSHVHVTFDPVNFFSMVGESQSAALLRSSENLRFLLMKGFTTVRDVATGPQWNFLTVDMRRAIERGMIAGPRMIVAPHCLSSTGGHGDFTGAMSPEIYALFQSYSVVDGPAEIRKAVRGEIKGRADWIKCAATGGYMSPTSDPGMATYTQEEMDTLVKTAHDQGIPVAVHAYGDEGIRRSLLAGADSVEHGNMASIETLGLMEKKGTFLIPTQYALEDDIANLDNSAYWAKRGPWEYTKTRKYAPQVLTCKKNLAASKVKIVFGTDTGSLPFEDSWKEFPTMVKNGISTQRALVAATSMAAEMLKRPDLGTLAVGKTADIIAMPGNPFQDINLTGQVDFVMKEGKVFSVPQPKP